MVWRLNHTFTFGPKVYVKVTYISDVDFFNSMIMINEYKYSLCSLQVNYHAYRIWPFYQKNSFSVESDRINWKVVFLEKYRKKRIKIHTPDMSKFTMLVCERLTRSISHTFPRMKTSDKLRKLFRTRPGVQTVVRWSHYNLKINI